MAPSKCEDFAIDDVRVRRRNKRSALPFSRSQLGNVLRSRSSPRKAGSQSLAPDSPCAGMSGVDSAMMAQCASLIAPYGTGGGMSLCGGGSRQHEILEAFAQHRLLNLAGRGVRDLVDENDLVGHPPLGDLAAHEFEDLVLGRRLILFDNGHEQRPLVPFGVFDADH